MTDGWRVLYVAVISLTDDFIGEGWSQVLAILAYNAGDLVGRGPLAAYAPCPMRFTWLGVAARFGIIGLVCLCVPPYALSASPWPLLCLVVPLGVSAGYLTSSVMASVTTRVSEQERCTAHL